MLSDLRVVDLTDDHGAMAGRVLADLGAEVVRVEPSDGGLGRQRHPFTNDGVSLHHAYRNAGKLIVSRDQLDGLLAGADLTFVSGGEDAAALAERHPHLVVVSVTAFGLSGPAAGWAATELVAQCLAGVVYRSGVPSLPPVSAPGSYAEDLGAVVAALAGLVALHQGGGQLVDVSTIRTLAQITDMSLPLWTLFHADQVRQGAGAYPLFECSDGLARVVLPMNPGDWRALIAWLGSPPEWTGPEWEEPMLGPDARAQVMARLPQQFTGRTRDEVWTDGERAGVRLTPVLTPAEVLTNEHTTARETFTDLPVGASTARAVGGVFSVNGVRAALRGPAVHGRAPVWPVRPVPPARTTGGAPLAGLRVLEIGTGVAAPEGGRVLGEWGADVIKIETRRRPDFQRMVLGSEMNPAFVTVARNKRVFGVDLGHDDGRRLVHQLLTSVDVIVENNATGVIDRLGLGWDTVHALNPRTVLVSTQLYGDRGPWAWRKGFGPGARAVGGLTWLWAHGPDAPRGVMTIHPDHFAGRLVALGALAGLRQRERTGEGCRVDLAQIEAVSYLLGDLLMAESLEPGAAVPTGNTHPDHAPWGVYRCADDPAESWLAVCVTDDDAWLRLLGVAAGAVPDAPAWRTEAGRVADRASLEAALDAWLRDVDARTVESSFQSAGVAAGVVVHPRLLVDHPAFEGFPEPVDQPGNGPLLLEGAAFTGTRLGRPRISPAPAFGQDTRQICTDLLGLSDDEIDALAAAGVLELS